MTALLTTAVATRLSRAQTLPGREAEAVAPASRPPLPLLVPRIARAIEVKMASQRGEWEQALQLVARKYQAKGLAPRDVQALHFTPYHALPDTITAIAKHDGRVVATLSAVADNHLLGVPMAKLYPDEISQLRQEHHRFAEATCLAAEDLDQHEFHAVFLTLIRALMQWHDRQRGNAAVIAVHPDHARFYTRLLGFAPLGSCRPYDAVQGAPAEGCWLSWAHMQTSSPQAYQRIFGEPLPAAALHAPRMSRGLMDEFSRRADQPCRQLLEQVYCYEDAFGSPRCW